jgi:hypothetical protein
MRRRGTGVILPKLQAQRHAKGGETHAQQHPSACEGLICAALDAT